AKTQTKSIEGVSDKPKEINNSINSDVDAKDSSNGNNENSSHKPSSISEIANILRNSNIEKGEK
ncbi:MAG: hypothetical protein GX321_07350, partial [Clostridiales bacterium]|nr:hypothetical protein [Clostridiales bacterium]